MKGADTRLHKRHERVFSLSRILMRPVAALLYRFHCERIPKVDGPVFLLCNHNTDLDCVLLGIASPRQVYFVATENVTRMGLLGKFVLYGFAPILHEKGAQGAGTTRAILRCIRDGYSVALFPEGNRSFNGCTCPIPPVTGKLARSCGATLITYRFTGGYLTTPRWGRGVRKGRLEGHVAGVYSPEQLKAMRPEEIQAAIERDLWTDACEEQKASPVRFRSRRRAEYLETLLYLCPQCGTLGSLRSKGHCVACESCAERMDFTEYGLLRFADGTERPLTELDRAQGERLAALADAAGGECLFSDAVTLRQVDENHRVLAEMPVTLAAFRDRFEAGGLSLPFSDVEGVSIVRRNLLQFQPKAGGGHYEFIGAPTFNALKYLRLYQHGIIPIDSRE